MKTKKCLACGNNLQGRSDKVFCDAHCKSSYHYRKSIQESPRFYNQVDNQLKLNRKILKSFNKSGKATIRASKLIELGFNPKFFTHYWKHVSAIKKLRAILLPCALSSYFSSCSLIDQRCNLHPRISDIWIGQTGTI